MTRPTELVVAHPTFGEIRWTAQAGCWTGRVTDTSGGGVDIVVSADEGDPRVALESVAVLYQKAIRAERRILRNALRAEVLELYNESWSGGSGELSEDELLNRLRLELVEISGANALEFHYDGTKLFGGHVLVIELDERLKFVDSDLR